MLPLAQIRERILEAAPDATVETVVNPGPSGQSSLLIDSEHALAVAHFLRDDPALKLDYCSNVTGVDWPEPPAQKDEAVAPHGFLEAVYHLYSTELKHGPLILRLRTGNRSDDIDLPSLTPAWRSAEFQEREIYDLYGIRFTGHPDLRRLLMWDEFDGHPMRKDYQPPADEEDREPFAPLRRIPS